MNSLRAVLHGLLTLLLALLLLFEEWGWEPLARALTRLAKLPQWAKLESHIQSLPRWAALLVFGIPVLALLPVKLLAIYLFSSGHKLLGLGLLLGAKLMGTAIVARLFQLTQPALMQFGWFSHWYPRWKTWKDGVIEQIRRSAVWQQGRKIKAQVRMLMVSVRRWWQSKP